MLKLQQKKTSTSSLIFFEKQLFLRVTCSRVKVKVKVKIKVKIKVRVKVKFTLQQATKAHRSRGIALLFL